ncbi:hypothetical protein DL95DRAFT_419163 [Leptodontidium sp. 2 PMI_412]|nr:hypothetical protein DL95DRAFT_419163 [Leptodontidium sp. 2 PMI_412]
MKQMMMKDAIAFSTVAGMEDANGNPLLQFHMNSTARPGAEYVFWKGWAKKREYVGAPLAKRVWTSRLGAVSMIGREVHIYGSRKEHTSTKGATDGITWRRRRLALLVEAT